MTNWPPQASTNLVNHFAPPPPAFWLATHGSRSTMVQTNVFVAAFCLSSPHDLNPTLVQLAELLRGGDPRPDNLTELHGGHRT